MVRSLIELIVFLVIGAGLGAFLGAGIRKMGIVDFDLPWQKKPEVGSPDHIEALRKTADLEHELDLIPHSSDAIRERCTHSSCRQLNQPRKMDSGGTKPPLGKLVPMEQVQTYMKNAQGRPAVVDEDVMVMLFGDDTPVMIYKKPVDDEEFDENEPLDDQIRNSIWD